MRSRLMLFIVVSCLAVLAARPSTAATNYTDWAAVVVAGDWHAHDGGPSEAFDNARRDISSELISLGFNRDNLVQFSVRPQRYPDTHPLQSDVATIANTLWDLSNRTSGGCLLYFSSHGSPGGLILGTSILEPDALESMVDNACGDRPTVVVISACFSGIFVPKLKGPNRMILTAARPDRTSFGCGTDDKYPYFDTCMVSRLPASRDFPTLASAVTACVANREKKTGMYPPSEPQTSIGAAIAAQLLPFQ